MIKYGIKSGQEVKFTPKIGRFEKTFSPELEELLVKHVMDLSNRCMPLMKKEFLRFTYDLAVALKIPHLFNSEKGAAGKHFYYDFMARHPDLSLRIPESTSLMRTVGFNKPQVDYFFTNLEHLLTLHNLPPSNIFNCDETGVSCVQKHSKVIAPNAVRQVGKLTSAERGKNITVLFCVSANGYFIPPFLVFPRQIMNDRLMTNAPAQSVGVAQPKGWMNSDFFLQWMHHFIKFSRPSKENPVLVLLDSHSNHKTLDVINYCREHHIHLMSSPPLDSTFMKPFKNSYHEQCDMWMRANPGARITDYDIAGLVNGAFTKVARLEIALSGFKCTGIYPLDKNIFSDLDFLPANVTNIPKQRKCSQMAPASSVLTVTMNSIPETSASIHPNLITNTTGNQLTNIVPEVESPNNTVPEPPTNTMFQLPTSTNFDAQPSTSFDPQPSTSSAPDMIDTMHKLSPLPDATKKRSAARRRKCEKSEILTSSPYKNAIEEKENEKKFKEAKKGIGKNLGRVIEENKEQRNCGKKICLKMSKKTSQEKSKKSEPLKQKSSNTETSCVVGLEDNDEDWIQCCSCYGWAHEACADIPECSETYVCDRCNLF